MALRTQPGAMDIVGYGDVLAGGAWQRGLLLAPGLSAAGLHLTGAAAALCAAAAAAVASAAVEWSAAAAAAARTQASTPRGLHA